MENIHCHTLRAPEVIVRLGWASSSTGVIGGLPAAAYRLGGKESALGAVTRIHRVILMFLYGKHLAFVAWWRGVKARIAARALK
jgi:hypothetical protein